MATPTQAQVPHRTIAMAQVARRRPTLGMVVTNVVLLALVAVMVIPSFTGYWNDFFWPLIVTTQPWMFVINVGLASLIGPYDYQYGIQLGGALLASLPVIIVFLIFQRQFVAGLTQGAF